METTRRPRGDHSGAFHHVTNRGLSSRPAFESRSDVRSFLALLAWQVHERRIEVHAYSILTTHFHLLLRSIRGELSDAMMRIEYRYVKRFNRQRERDGSLFRSRFRSRLIDTDEYWFNVIRYIDANAVDAGLCVKAADYEFGSARAYTGGRSPPWLARGEVEQAVRRIRRATRFHAADYERVFGVQLDPEDRWVVERRMDQGGPNPGADEQGNELLRAAPEHVVRWLRSRASLADRGSVGIVLASPARVRRIVQLECERRKVGEEAAGATSASEWRALEAGLLRQLCGLTLQEVSETLGVSRTCAWTRCSAHDARLSRESRYERLVERVVRALQPGRLAGVGEEP